MGFFPPSALGLVWMLGVEGLGGGRWSWPPERLGYREDQSGAADVAWDNIHMVNLELWLPRSRFPLNGERERTGLTRDRGK